MFGDVGCSQFCHCMRAFIVGGLVVVLSGRDWFDEGKRCFVIVLIRTPIVSALGNNVDKMGATGVKLTAAIGYE
jgi:hypothetical protein